MMNHSLLHALMPSLIALLIAGGLLWLVQRLSGARWNLRRLRELHRCQEGGVQSLAFVLTLPVFLVILLFIVQVSQLMVAITVVHYSAFNAARSAIVWLPAHLPDEEDEDEGEPQNRLWIASHREEGDQFFLIPSEQSIKYRQIRTAAVLGCVSICPSRDLGIPASSLRPESRQAADASLKIYQAAVPGSVRNGRLRQRLYNKVAYADRNTFVVLSWRDAKNAGGGRETYRSPTYNPRNYPCPDQFPWHPGEVGWQDAVTVHVVHRFALLPGPGRLLAKHLVPSSGIPDEVYDKIITDRQSYSEPVYSVEIPASATLTNEGMKSVRPFEQWPYVDR